MTSGSTCSTVPPVQRVKERDDLELLGCTTIAEDVLPAEGGRIVEEEGIELVRGMLSSIWAHVGISGIK